MAPLQNFSFYAIIYINFCYYFILYVHSSFIATLEAATPPTNLLSSITAKSGTKLNFDLVFVAKINLTYA